ncbi:MAG: hypothetical protein ACI4U2_02300 [Christensenellaceae bacterium]
MKTNRNRAVGFLLAVGFCVGSALSLVGCGANTPTGPVTGPGSEVQLVPEPVQDWGYMHSMWERKFVEFLSCELSPVAQEGYAMLTLFYQLESETEIDGLVGVAVGCRDEIWQYASIDDLYQNKSERVRFNSQGVLISRNEGSFTFLVKTPDIIDWRRIDTEKTTVSPEDVRYLALFWVGVKHGATEEGGGVEEYYWLSLNYNGERVLPWVEGETPWIKD